MSEATIGSAKQSGERDANCYLIHETGIEPGMKHAPHCACFEELTLGFLLTYDEIEWLLVCVNGMSEATIGNVKLSGSS